MQIGSRLLNLGIAVGVRTANSEIRIKGKKRGAAMPRPGSRPYECVKRAWHSDRHKPLRGSIIQHIFRLVGEAHGEKTKNNREWQEKLPNVVFKCEEIMYSKANTETEYLDQDTLWDRISDAVNTVIRFEEVKEKGKLLPPCVEAALTLGCVPVKATRSQRHCNTQTYLRPVPQDQNDVPQRTVNSATTQKCPRTGPVDLSLLTPDRNLVRNKDIINEPCSLTLPHKAFQSRGAHQAMPIESDSSLNFDSVYHLYYGAGYQFKDLPVGVNQQKCVRCDSEEILIGRPVARLIPKPARMATSRSIVTEGTAKATIQTDTQLIDLSLQLGVSSSLDVDKENNCQLQLCSGRWNSDDGVL